MQIKIVNDKTVWDNFVTSFHNHSILQSSAWWGFEESQGRSVFPLGIYDDSDQLVGVSLFSKVISRRANYLVSQGGPVLDWENRNGVFIFLHKYLIGLSKKEKVDFFRIRPMIPHGENEVRAFGQSGYRLAPMYFPAEHTLLLDLSPSEDELMRGMRKQTRYYSRKAEKVGVEVKISQDSKDIQAFYDLYQKTVDRHGFVPYTLEYFQKEFQSFKEQDMVDLVLGYYEGELVSAAMIIYYGNTAYYHHGASERLDPDVFGSYLVIWNAIKQAKARGYKQLDFWGVAPNDDRGHPRAGITIFKRGFGGKRFRWLHTLDYPTSWKYWLMYVYVRWERWRRGL